MRAWLVFLEETGSELLRQPVVENEIEKVVIPVEGDGKPSAEFLRQPGRKLLEQLGPIRRPFLPVLLVLDDAAANLKVGHHLEVINHGRHATSRGLDELADLGDELSESIGLRLCERGRFLGCGLPDSGIPGSRFLFYRVSASISRTFRFARVSAN